MSEEEANIVTHDNIGTEPTVELRFVVLWTNYGCTDLVSVIKTPNVRNWESFKRELFEHSGHSIIDQVTYIDSESDAIPIESQCEFDEALRIATHLLKRQLTLYLVVDGGFDPIFQLARKKKLIPRVTSTIMPPTNLNDNGKDLERIQPRDETNYNATVPKPSDDEAPKWFTSYMQTMKDEIVAEVSKRVTETVMEAIQKKKPDSNYDSATSHPRATDPEYLLDSDSDDSRTKIPANELADEENKNSDHTLAPGSHRCDDDDDDDDDDDSRNRFRNFEKQRKKRNRSNVSRGYKNLVTSSQACCDSSLNDRRSDEKFPNKRSNVNSRESPARSSCKNYEFSEEILNTRNPRDNKSFIEEYDTPYRRMIASGINQMSFIPVDSKDSPEAPILKVRLAHSFHAAATSFETASINEKLRLGCSITGVSDIHEKTNDRVSEYCALSDSDNISIISNVSHNSDILRIINDFEMINDERPINFTGYTDEDRELVVTTEYDETNDDLPEANRESSSFELLSEPGGSPSLLIRMDEDHFSPGKNETNANYNINDDATSLKRGNENKIDTSLAIDAQGKIYQCNIMEINEDDCTDVIFEKRTDGTYSFVADTLPGETREIIVKTAAAADSSNDETIIVNANEATTMKQCPNETNLSGNESTEVNSSDYFHESTQSFHSHTANQTANDPTNFTEYSRNDENSEAPVMRNSRFVDENASKGLGDEKHWSSPRKRVCDYEKRENLGLGKQEKSSKESKITNRGSSSRLEKNINRNFTNDEASGITGNSNIFVDDKASKGLGDNKRWTPGRRQASSNIHRKPEKPRKSSSSSSFTKEYGKSRRDDGTRIFADWSTTRTTMIDDLVFNAVDPMHILPETLVAGVVQVAESAYTTARRVYDKILTAETRKPADKSKFGRR